MLLQLVVVQGRQKGHPVLNIMPKPMRSSRGWKEEVVEVKIVKNWLMEEEEKPRGRLKNKK